MNEISLNLAKEILCLHTKVFNLSVRDALKQSRALNEYIEARIAESEFYYPDVIGFIEENGLENI